jgi:hypothetical protein
LHCGTNSEHCVKDAWDGRSESLPYNRSISLPAVPYLLTTTKLDRLEGTGKEPIQEDGLRLLLGQCYGEKDYSRDAGDMSEVYFMTRAGSDGLERAEK